MKKYKVNGTIELNFELMVEADTEQAAENDAKLMVEDGDGLGVPVDSPEITSIEEIKA